MRVLRYLEDKRRKNDTATGAGVFSLVKLSARILHENARLLECDRRV